MERFSKRMADQLGLIYQDSKFAALFPARGQPAEAPARLALITVLQFVEGLSDRQAADAVRGRIDWKYLLGLELTDPGFNFSVLSEFRARLISGEADLWLLDGLLTRLESLDLIKRRGRQRTDSTHVLAAVRGLNRLERVSETLRATLNSLAVVAPDWLQAQAPKAWYERYSHRVKNSQDRGGSPGTGGGHRGRWGQLLQAVAAATDSPELVAVPAVQILRQVWAEQYVEEAGRLRWRTVAEMPAPAELISFPYDPEARYSTKYDMAWVGYKVHFRRLVIQRDPI
jgi:transposase